MVMYSSKLSVSYKLPALSAWSALSALSALSVLSALSTFFCMSALFALSALSVFSALFVQFSFRNGCCEIRKNTPKSYEMGLRSDPLRKMSIENMTVLNDASMR